MLTKTIKFKDLDGNDVEETFYFRLSKAEVGEMELSYEGGLAAHLRRMTQAKKPDGALIISTFREFVAKSVGKRSDDGRRFIKNQEITDEFMQSDAYSEFFMDLVTDAEAGARFVRGIMPQDLVEKLNNGERLTDVPLPDPVEQPKQIEGGETTREKYERLLADPDWQPSKADMIAMDKDQMTRAFQRKLKED